MDYIVTGQCEVDPADRIECGYPGIGQERCLARPGCCFDNSISGVKWCFKEKTIEPKPEPQPEPEPEPEPSKKGMNPLSYLQRMSIYFVETPPISTFCK